MAGSETTNENVPLMEIAKRAQEGDNDAVTELCHRFESFYRRIAKNMGVADCEDVVQDIIVRVIANIAAVDLKSHPEFVRWMNTVGRNQVATRIARDARRPTVERLYGDTKIGMTHRSESEVHELQDAVRIAVERLPPRQKQIIKLWLNKDKPRSKELARILGISDKATRALLSRARSAMNRILIEMGFSEHDLDF